MLLTTIRLPACLLLCCALLAAATARADTEAAPDGQQIYERMCGRCHNPGAAAFFSGAPRLAQAGSADALAASAARGKGYMPPQGGPHGLSDAELKAAVTYILGKSGL